MKLVASMIVKDEADRYLRPCLDHLLEFCDEVRVLDDGSTDDFQMHGWHGDPRVVVMRTSESLFFQHEGRARQALLEWTFEAEPDYVLAIDADEFVADGAALRRMVDLGRHPVMTLNMQEVWWADRAGLRTREDGGWKQHPVPIVYQVPARRNPYHWRMRDSALACGREPKAVTAIRNRARSPVTDILHFGWANVGDRRERYNRYRDADGGKFHRSAHLNSIMVPDTQVSMRERPWPLALEAYVDDIADRAQLGSDGAFVPIQGGVSVPEPLVLSDPDTPGTSLAEYAWYRRNPDGRWVAINWDGEIEHGSGP
jgi:hypothetical protein